MRLRRRRFCRSRLCERRFCRRRFNGRRFRRAYLWGTSLYRTSLRSVVCGIAVGFLLTSIQAHLYLKDRWPTQRDGDRVIATVIIDTIPVIRGDSRSFDAIATIDNPTPTPNALRVRITSRAPEVAPHVGDRWRLLMTLRPPRARVNPGTADLERMLFHDRIHALGTVISASINHRIDGGHRPLDELRERIARHIDARVPDRDAAALISALAVGVTSAMSREQWRVFNATGTTHLVAISGMHVTLFAVIMFAVARRCWALCVTLGLRVASLPRETFAAIFGFLAAAGYAALAGLSVPTERTLIMLGVWLFARSVARASHPFQPFALALLLVLLIDPFAPLSAGFWLSFAAMAAIIVSASGRFTRQPLWREALAVQMIVSIALLPFTLALFGSVPLIGLPVNLLAIPAMSWVLVPTVLLALALLPLSTVASNAVLALAEWLHNLGWPWLAAASDVPWALIHASPPWWWYALAVVALGFAAAPWPLLMRIAALICVAPLAASIERPLKAGAAEIAVLDVGEGFSVVVRTAHHVLVYGTGDSYGTNGRMAEAVVVPFLRSSGIHEIDRLAIPRNSPASGAGAVALLAEMPIDQTLVGDPGATGDSANVDCASVPSVWRWDGVTFALGSVAGSGHACALTIRTGAGEVRIPGDIDAVVVDSVEHRWLVVSGRRAQRSLAKYAGLHPGLQDAEVLAASDLGAIRVRLEGARGPEVPEAYRAHRRTLWSGSP